jgi:CxC4 like cysteine cluster associated with KDZ transposases
MYDVASNVMERPCTIYSLAEPLETLIQLQKCPNCPVARHRFIGPDARESGLFNYNNSILFTHKLLDEYTSSFTTSETPFVAWVSVVSRRYASNGHEFVSNALFHSVWFAYVRIQLFNNDLF